MGLDGWYCAFPHLACLKNRGIWKTPTLDLHSGPPGLCPTMSYCLHHSPRKGQAPVTLLGISACVVSYNDEQQKLSRLISNLQTFRTNSCAIKILANLDIKIRNLPET